MESFAETIRRIADEVSDPDPAVVHEAAVSEVIRSGSSERIEGALYEASRDFVRNLLAIRARDLPDAPELTERRPRSALQQMRPDPTAPIFRGRMYGGPEVGWFLIGEATRMMLFAAADYKDVKAAEIVAAAQRVRRLAFMLPDDEAKVQDMVSAETLRDLFAGGLDEAAVLDLDDGEAA